MLIPLKLKYRVHKSFKCGTYKARTGNTHGPTPKWKSIWSTRKKGSGKK